MSTSDRLKPKAAIEERKSPAGPPLSAEVKESEQRFKELFKHLPIPTYLWKRLDDDFIFFDANDAGLAVTNGQASTVFGISVSKLYATRPDIVADITRCFDQRTTIKREMTYSFQVVDKTAELVVTYVYVPPDMVMVHTEDVTERKKAEAALRDSNERYRALFENAPLGLGVANEQGKLLAFNDAMMQPGGYTREDIERIGNVAALYAFPEERDRALSLARAQGYLRQHEVRFRRKDGSTYLARLSLQPITLDGQRGWQAMAEDITERKKAEVALAESEERLRLALEAGGMGIWAWDIPTGKIVWSERHSTLFGMKHGEFDGSYEMFIKCVHPEDRAVVENTIQTARQQHTHMQHDLRVVWPDGSIHWISGRGQFDYNADGEAVRMYGVVWDITDRKQAEEKLRKSEASLREAQRVAKLGHWDWNLQTNEASWSEELYAIAALDPSVRITYETFFSLIHPDDHEPIKQAVADALVGRRPYNIEMRMIRPNGEVRVCHSQGQVGFGENGTAVRLHGTLQDITERKQLAMQLLQAQKMESLGRLAGGLAHEFNNLLTGIFGYTELLALKAGPQFSEDLAGIRQMAARAATLTRQLLDFSRRQTVAPKVIDLNEVIRAMTDMLRRLLGASIQLQSLLSSGLASVKIDPAQFEQVLLNLTLNARDTMSAGGTLRIETENCRLDADQAQQFGGVPAGAYVCVTVTDSGTGIRDEIKKHLFEPFYTTKETGRGTGLGLATCYGIITQNGGHIWAEDAPGGGASFKLILPACAEVPEKRAPANTPFLPSGRERVLLVEDEPDVRHVMACSLRNAGYTLLCAGDGREAMKVLNDAGHDIDLLITDLVMPGLGGRELAQQLGARVKNLRTLFISGYTADDVMRESILSERVDFLQKPFTPESLILKIREVLDRR
ncbi:MAG TPA: PAS domain S-box protein [Planctomycetota bacterium]|nr:PAS domain S-box protein [Planctomycetota bacterium]